MRPLLYFGREFLNKMSDPEISDSVRESYSRDFVSYTDQYPEAAAEFLAAFQALGSEELAELPGGSLLWYLDWIGDMPAELRAQVDAERVIRVWQVATDALVRTRAVETLLLIDVQAIDLLARGFPREREDDDRSSLLDDIIDTLLGAYLGGVAVAADVLRTVFKAQPDARERFEVRIEGLEVELPAEVRSELGLG